MKILLCLVLVAFATAVPVKQKRLYNRPQLLPPVEFKRGEYHGTVGTWADLNKIGRDLNQKRLLTDLLKWPILPEIPDYIKKSAEVQKRLLNVNKWLILPEIPDFKKSAEEQDFVGGSSIFDKYPYIMSKKNAPEQDIYISRPIIEPFIPYKKNTLVNYQGCGITKWC